MAITPPTRTAEQPSLTLNDEVTEAIGQLERFWGGFGKQVCASTTSRHAALTIFSALQKGQSAIQTTWKDLGDYVSQAQKGINQQLTALSVATPAPATDADAQSPTASPSTRDLTDSIDSYYNRPSRPGSMPPSPPIHTSRPRSPTYPPTSSYFRSSSTRYGGDTWPPLHPLERRSSLC